MKHILSLSLALLVCSPASVYLQEAESGDITQVLTAVVDEAQKAVDEKVVAGIQNLASAEAETERQKEILAADLADQEEVTALREAVAELKQEQNEENSLSLTPEADTKDLPNATADALISALAAQLPETPVSKKTTEQPEEDLGMIAPEEIEAAEQSLEINGTRVSPKTVVAQKQKPDAAALAEAEAAQKAAEARQTANNKSDAQSPFNFLNSIMNAEGEGGEGGEQEFEFPEIPEEELAKLDELFKNINFDDLFKSLEASGIEVDEKALAE